MAIDAVPTTTGLHLLVDSTGIKMLGEGEWKTKKHGAEYPANGVRYIWIYLSTLDPNHGSDRQ